MKFLWNFIILSLFSFRAWKDCHDANVLPIGLQKSQSFLNYRKNVFIWES